MERIVPHVNLKFNRNLKKMSSETRIEPGQSKKHNFNGDVKN